MPTDTDATSDSDIDYASIFDLHDLLDLDDTDVTPDMDDQVDYASLIDQLDLSRLLRPRTSIELRWPYKLTVTGVVSRGFCCDEVVSQLEEPWLLLQKCSPHWIDAVAAVDELGNDDMRVGLVRAVLVGFVGEDARVTALRQ